MNDLQQCGKLYVQFIVPYCIPCPKCVHKIFPPLHLFRLFERIQLEYLLRDAKVYALCYIAFL